MRPVPRATGRVIVLVGLLVARLATGQASDSSRRSSSPQNLTVTGDTLYFSADDGLHGRELWCVELGGTPRLVADIERGPVSSMPSHFCNGGSSLFFKAKTSTHGDEPWVYNPSEGRPRLLQDITPGTASSSANYVKLQPDRLCILTGGAGRVGKLWVIDVKTSSVDHLIDAGRWSEPTYAALSDGRLLFRLQLQLWVTAGSKDDTFLIAEREEIFNLREMASLGDLAVLTMVHPDCGQELFSNDGTVDNITLVKDISPGLAGSNVRNLFVAGGRVYFEADDGEHGLELWCTDGTAEGTFMVKDIWPGRGGSDPHYFVQMGDAVYFAASDGTSGGLRLVCGIWFRSFVLLRLL